MKYYVMTDWTIRGSVKRPAAYLKAFDSYLQAMAYVEKYQPGATGRNKYAR